MTCYDLAFRNRGDMPLSEGHLFPGLLVNYMDRVSPSIRSRIMGCIRGKNTQPELRTRKYLYAAGCRYRLHDSRLSGCPDLVFATKRICLFVHGCFWHGCPKCSDGRRKPKSNRDYWLPKIQGNRQRDRQHVSDLRAAGWTVLIIWECETMDVKNLERLLKTILRKRTW